MSLDPASRSSVVDTDPPGPPRPALDATADERAASGAIAARLDAIVARAIGCRPGTFGAAELVGAARATAFELDLPLEELPARAIVSDHLRRALVTHLGAEPRRFLEPVASFEAVVEHTCARLAGGATRQRVLVLGCGAGEDAYSVALAMVDHGVDPEWFEIEAIDPREAALRRARAGIYGAASFGDAALSARERHFVRRGDSVQLLGSLRHLVHFVHGDPRDPEPWRAAPRHDVVVCRDLLAQCEPQARRAVIEQIARRLAPGGLLVLGTRDRGPAQAAGFTAFGRSGARAWRRAGGSAGVERDRLVASTQRIDAAGGALRRLVVDGLMHLRAGDHAAADALFRQAIAGEPSCRQAIELLARAATNERGLERQRR